MVQGQLERAGERGGRGGNRRRGEERGGESCMFESREEEALPIHWTRGSSAQRQARSVKSIPQRQRGVPPSRPQLTSPNPIPSIRRSNEEEKATEARLPTRTSRRYNLTLVPSPPSRKYNVQTRGTTKRVKGTPVYLRSPPTPDPRRPARTRLDPETRPFPRDPELRRYPRGAESRVKRASPPAGPNPLTPNGPPFLAIFQYCSRRAANVSLQGRPLA